MINHRVYICIQCLLRISLNSSFNLKIITVFFRAPQNIAFTIHFQNSTIWNRCHQINCTIFGISTSCNIAWSSIKYFGSKVWIHMCLFIHSISNNTKINRISQYFCIRNRLTWLKFLHCLLLPHSSHRRRKRRHRWISHDHHKSEKQCQKSS